MHTLIRSVLGALVCLVAPAAGAGVLLVPTQASEWKCSEWINGDPGALAKQRGKVVVVHFFQMWCPGTNEFSIPLLLEWEKKYADRSDVVLVSVHSVFEGHAAQTPELLKVFVAEKGIHHPVCVDAYVTPGAETPITMESYQAGGTPQVAVVDKTGALRFNHFGKFDRVPVEFFIGRLADDKTTSSGKMSSADSKPGRSKPPRPAPAAPAAPSPTQPAAAIAGPSPLAGTYKIVIQQSSKSCGEPLPSTDVIAEVSVAGENLEARFTRPVFGLTHVKADYDDSSRTFIGDLIEKAKDKNLPLDINLSFHGTFHDASPEPTVEFQFSFGMRSEDGTADCAVEGHGQGTRLKAR